MVNRNNAKLQPDSTRQGLSDTASEVWNSFWSLPAEERDYLLTELLRSIPLTLIVGGESKGRHLKVFRKQDITGILGSMVDGAHVRSNPETQCR
jgi:hypothetical protein